MCEQRERLIGYLYDECDAEERQLIDRHLETCHTCRDEISGLRQVREDLLAWDVPARESVWQPFAPPRPAPWWREVPAWALAAAASVTFFAGAAGGAATYALLPHPTASAVVAERTEPRQPVVPVAYDNVTRRELTAAEQRIVDLLRAEMADRISRTRAGDGPSTLRVSNSASSESALTDADHTDLVHIVQAIMGDVVEHRRVTDDRIQDLRSQVDYLRTAVTSPPGR
jgi:hypothetical protein